MKSKDMAATVAAKVIQVTRLAAIAEINRIPETVVDQNPVQAAIRKTVGVHKAMAILHNVDLHQWMKTNNVK
jgi:hypothetical protein